MEIFLENKNYKTTTHSRRRRQSQSKRSKTIQWIKANERDRTSYDGRTHGDACLN